MLAFVGKAPHDLAEASKFGSDPLSTLGAACSWSSAAKTRLRHVLRPRKTTINYLYDFGDS